MKEKIANSVIRVHYTAGTKIIRQGENGDTFFMIAEGRVSCILHKANNEGEVLRQYGPLEYFGEGSLLVDPAEEGAK